MNKKYLMFGIPLLAIGLVIALTTYYLMFSASFTVDSSITSESSLVQELENVFSGEIIEGNPITILNNAPSERTIIISDNSDEDVSVSYLVSMDMETKDSDWDVTGTGAILYYTIVGENFVYKVDRELINYVLIYYPDVDGNPGSWNIDEAIYIGDAGTELTISNLDKDLPIESDWNNEAKLWLIPSDDWETKSWNPTEWFFEHNLVSYTNADTGSITIPSVDEITLTPVYVVGDHASGKYTITTTIE